MHLRPCGEMAEWSNAADSKSVVRFFSYREFESHSLRQKNRNIASRCFFYAKHKIKHYLLKPAVRKGHSCFFNPSIPLKAILVGIKLARFLLHAFQANRETHYHAQNWAHKLCTFPHLYPTKPTDKNRQLICSLCHLYKRNLRQLCFRS